MRLSRLHLLLRIKHALQLLRIEDSVEGLEVTNKAPDSPRAQFQSGSRGHRVVRPHVGQAALDEPQAFFVFWREASERLHGFWPGQGAEIAQQLLRLRAFPLNAELRQPGLLLQGCGPSLRRQ